MKGVITILLLCAQQISGGNILIMLPTPLRSHLNLFTAVIEILQSDHKIHFYTVLPPNKPLPGVEIQPIEILNPIGNRKEDYAKYFNKLYKMDLYEQMINMMDYIIFPNFMNQIFQGKSIQKLLKSTTKFDALIILNFGAEYFTPFTHKFNIPLIQFTGGVLSPWTSKNMGNYNKIAIDQSYMAIELSNTFKGRLLKFLKQAYTWMYYQRSYLPYVEEVSKRYFPSNTPSINQIMDQTSVLFVNTISTMGFSREYVQNIVEIGGLHCKPSKRLPNDLEEFMQDSGEHGVIYFSLGGTVNENGISNQLIQTFLKVFDKLPQNILWKWEGYIKNTPKNVRLSKWLPQQDVLGHNKTKLFITQGGMLSLQEAAYHAVPVLVVPVITDQHNNAEVVTNQGYGLAEKFLTLTEQGFYGKIKELLSQAKYKQRIKEISGLMKDQQSTASERLKWWTNYVIRHKNLTVFRPMHHDLPLFALMQIDVYFTIFGLCVFVAVIIFLFLRFISGFMETKTRKEKSQ